MSLVTDPMAVTDLVASASAVLGVPARVAGSVIWSPGRVNLIGDHIDYSGGLVLPMALDRGTHAVVFPRDDELLRGYSANFAADGVMQASLADTGFDASRGWFSYVLAVIDTAIAAGHRPAHGWDIYLTGDIPAGGGLSSSASVELAVATAMEHMFDFGLDPTQWAVLCQRAENEYIGVASGIMDQLAIARGRAGDALLMDCASLACEYVPMPADCTVVIANTRHKRQLVGSAYNDRRAAVVRAAAIVAAEVDDAPQDLVGLRLDQLELVRGSLEAAGVWREARHTVTEQARVVGAAAALAAGDLATVGRLMRESHESLRDDFAVTGPQLDALVDVAWATPGVIGARMTGAGFGGCTVNLVRPDSVAAAAAAISAGYAAITGITPEVFPVAAGDGARVLA